MQIILAKTAGFCFGVNRAVKLTYELLEQGRPVATLGPLIHNPQVVEDLESKGAITCDSVDDVPDGCEVVIRSHGVGQSVYDKISTRRLAYHDATCPFVTKIHKIAVRRAPCCWWQAMPNTPKYRELWAILREKWKCLPTWQSWKNCCRNSHNKNLFLR